MIDQIIPKASSVSPCFCCQMKGSTFFIVFSVFMILLHLYIPFFSGVILFDKHGHHISNSPNESYIYEKHYVKVPTEYEKLNMQRIEYVPRLKTAEDYINQTPNFKSMNSSLRQNYRILSKSFMDNSLSQDKFSNPEFNMGTAPRMNRMSDAYSDIVKQGSPQESRLELDTEDLIFIFTSCHQLFMLCFLVLCLIFFCMKHRVGNFLSFAFSISNLINSFIYIFVLVFLYSMIMIEMSNEHIDIALGTLVFLFFLVIYGFNCYWSFLLLKVSKDLIPVKNAEENMELAQENMA